MNSFVAKIMKKNMRNDDASPQCLTEARERCVCSWNTGGGCDTEIHYLDLFLHQIAVMCCSVHFEKHIKTMMLHQFDMDVEEILGDLDNLFVKTFDTNEVNRDSCIKFLAKIGVPNIEAASDDELVEEVSKRM